MTGSPKKQRKRQQRSPNKRYYPVFLDITGKPWVIVGGGKVAERKCSSLIRAGARVTVISPEITEGLRTYRDKDLIRHVKRQYRTGDIASAFAVIVATDSEETNKKVAADAPRNALLNVVDTPSLCTFITPSVLVRGPLTIAVSTGGVSPAMARTIRKGLGAHYGSEVPKYLRFLKGVRLVAVKKIQDRGRRERVLKELASERMMRILVQEGFQAARKEALLVWQKQKG
jgi:precorrin-2 dehydrogenase/sirohydrochlorin ferrochelatase